jgi:hypothetical protein
VPEVGVPLHTLPLFVQSHPEKIHLSFSPVQSAQLVQAAITGVGAGDPTSVVKVVGDAVIPSHILAGHFPPLLQS